MEEIKTKYRGYSTKGERHSVTEIAALLGYDTLQSFSKAFRRITGCCPTEYKNTWKKLQCNSSGPDLK